VVARLLIEERHLQSLGLVHGGVHASVAETIASLGASVNAYTRDPGSVCIGLENHTTFLRASRAGTEVVYTAAPRHAGNRTQSWMVTAVDATSGKELATSNVRLIVVKPGEF
jgi:1,4-dihydroxy-2-naphthoyl-CoA hydrolase